MIIDQFDWSAVNTALLIAAVAYLWRQARVVDQVRQVLLGYGQQGGLIREMQALGVRTEDLAKSMNSLSAEVGRLASDMEQIRAWRGMGTGPPSPERRG